MSSDEKNEKPVSEKRSAMKENLDIDDKLRDLSSCFSWGMEKVIENRHKLLDTNENRLEMVVDLQDQFPEFSLIYHLMLAYENFMENDLANAMKSINNAEETLAEIEKKAPLEKVENVLQHIFVAAKCHVLQKVGRAEEVDQLLKGICDVAEMDEMELAMLNGCQCLSWMLYYATDNLEAIKCAEKAIEYQPDNGKWYFLMAKNYRRLRRRHDSIGEPPSPHEKSAFEKAFELSPNVLFGVSLAQLYRESRNHPMASKIYKKVYDLEPTCCKVRLQLALGFIRAKQNMLAKDCLDYVAEKMPNSIIYDHYMGIYQEKCNRNFRAALPYYTRTTENTNFAAERQYIECRKKVEPHWDPLPYMLGMLKKYDKDTDHVIQGINIEIGAYYLFEKKDILSACPYFTKAIEISPNAKHLKDYHRVFRSFEGVNIYYATTKEVEFALNNGATSYNDDEIAVLKNMLQLCRKNCKDSTYSRGETPSSQMSSNYRNYRHDNSSRAGISVGGERFGSSSRGSWRDHRERDRGNSHSLRKGFPGSFRDEKDSASSDRGRGSAARLTGPSKPHKENNDNEEGAACCLVKTFKNLDL